MTTVETNTIVSALMLAHVVHSGTKPPLIGDRLRKARTLTRWFPTGKHFHMEMLTSRQAADQLGVNAQKFHRLVASHGVNPVLEADGIRGVKFWNPRDIDRLGGELANEGAA